MKQIEVVRWTPNPGPITVYPWLTIIDPEKCAASALSVLKKAVRDKNERIRVDRSICLQNAKEQLHLLEVCGCKIKIVDV